LALPKFLRGGALSAKGLAIDGLQLPLQGLPAFLRGGMVHIDDLRNENFEVLSGQTVRYDRKADSGNVTAANFCAHCYGWLWSSNPTLPGIKVARAGTLDKMDWAEPIGNIWTDSKAAWAKIDPQLVDFPKQAMDRTPLFDAWTQHNQD
jgi:hypothetical protein